MKRRLFPESRLMFQSTPPRGRRLRNAGPQTADQGVSIHASAWEATSACRGNFQQGKVSIHASAWEATHSRLTGWQQMRGFNPRLRVGGDFASSCVWFWSERVSIHASAWEATASGVVSSSEHCVSIHASAWEATFPRLHLLFQFPFQSTPPRGRRRSWQRLGFDTGGFNPRLRVGGDQPSPQAGAHTAVSIHASAWEATTPKPWPRSTTKFQSTPPRGRRPPAAVAAPGARFRFNPRLRVGGDACVLRGNLDASFQSTPPRGRRRSA